MKFHRNLVHAVVKGLGDILLLNKQADTTVEQLLQSNKGWGSRDRAFIADNIYTIVRFKRLFEFCCQTEATSPEWLYRLLGTRLLLQDIELPEWDEFKGLNAESIKARQLQAASVVKIAESIPDWLDDMGQAELGENWPAEMHALNQPARFCIRVNTLRTTRAALLAVFDKEQIEYSEIPGLPNGLLLPAKKNFRNHFAYKSGWFEVQDASSQLVAPFLQVKEGMRVIDACAGGGGKTLHIAASLNNSGKLMALDVNANKLEELKKRAMRGGVNNLEAKLAEPQNIEHLKHYADRLLLDVPCSGTGVMRRKPDAKWKMTPAFMEEVRRVQASILNNYHNMLKPGGILVYSTCSIFPSENEKQVQAFLQSNTGFELVEQQSISPALSGFDGFYMARLKKKA